MKRVIVFTMALLAASTTIFAATPATGKPPVNPKPIYCTVCSSSLMLSKKEEMKMEVMKIYSCSTHPDQTSSKPGLCPKCNKKMTGGKAHDHAKK